MKKIEIPTGNSTIDWLLENERNGLSEMNADQAVRFLIDKQNEIIEVINTLQASTDKSKLLLADVNKRREQLKATIKEQSEQLRLYSVSGSIAIEYAEFCVRCDREKLPLLCLEDYIKQYCG